MESVITKETTRKGQYERINIPLDPNEVTILIGGKEKRKEILGIRVRTTGTRLKSFKRSLVCCLCGIKGTSFYLERNYTHKPGKDGKDRDWGHGWHLNLYAAVNGGERLMTRDHWIPKSKGGKDSAANCRTMCCRCNRKKADSMPDNL